MIKLLEDQFAAAFHAELNKALGKTASSPTNQTVSIPLHNPTLKAEQVFELVRSLSRREGYSMGMIWQPEYTEFCFLNGMRGYGVPWIEDRNTAYLVKESSLFKL